MEKGSNKVPRICNRLAGLQTNQAFPLVSIIGVG